MEVTSDGPDLVIYHLDANTIHDTELTIPSETST